MAVSGDVDGLEPADPVAVAVPVIQLVLRVEVGLLGDVRFEAISLDCGVEPADVVGVGVREDEPLGFEPRGSVEILNR